jgi:hypothetical protein
MQGDIRDELVERMDMRLGKAMSMDFLRALHSVKSGSVMYFI